MAKAKENQTTGPWIVGAYVGHKGTWPTYRVMSVSSNYVVLQRLVTLWHGELSGDGAKPRRRKRETMPGWGEYLSLGNYETARASDQIVLGPDGTWTGQQCLNEEMGVHAPVRIQIEQRGNQWVIRYLDDGAPVLHLGGDYSYTHADENA